MGSGHPPAKPGPRRYSPPASVPTSLTGAEVRAGAPSVLFPAPRGVLLSGCLRSDYLPFGPRGSTVSGRHVYGRAIGAGDFSIRRFYRVSVRARCASSVRLARFHRLDPTGSSLPARFRCGPVAKYSGKMRLIFKGGVRPIRSAISLSAPRSLGLSRSSRQWVPTPDRSRPPSGFSIA